MSAARRLHLVRPLSLLRAGPRPQLRTQQRENPVDAYTGETPFYILDATDPIASTYARIFPRPLRADRIDARLCAPLALPRDTVSSTNHSFMPPTTCTTPRSSTTVKTSGTFHRSWSRPSKQDGAVLRHDARPQLPDEAGISADPPLRPQAEAEHGRLALRRLRWRRLRRIGIVKLAKDRLVYGPLQVEARADPDPTISQQLSLWNQRGSRVLRGNLLVIPLEDTFLYIEPLYLEAESGQLPELTRIIVAYDDKVAMAPTLDEALMQVLNGTLTDSGDRTTPGAPPEGDLESLAAQAWERYQAAQACLETGDWMCYGEEQAVLEEILKAMVGE